MKILQVVHSFPTFRKAGVELLTSNLCTELVRRHEIGVFHPVHDGGHGELRETAHDGIRRFETHVRDGLLGTLSGYRSVLTDDRRIERAFEAVLTRFDPDVVHVQHLLWLPLGLPAIAAKRARVVVTLNDFWMLCPTTHFLDTDDLLCNRPPTDVCLRCVSGGAFRGMMRRSGLAGRRKTPFFAALRSLHGKLFLHASGRGLIERRDRAIQRILREADAITAISAAIVRKAHIQGNLPPELLDKVTVVTPGIDAASLTGTARRPRDSMVFGYVGAKEERKGTHLLIQAFKAIDSPQAELRLYGKTDRGSAYVRDLIAASAGDARIRFMGEFDDPSTPYAEMDVLVVPSMAYEGFGLVVAEAFAARVPVIAADIGALNESVRHEVNGLLFERANPEDLGRKMRQIIDDPGTMARLQANLRPPKSIAEYAAELERVYEQLMVRP